MRRWARPVQATLGRINVLSGAAYCYRTAALRAIGGVPVVHIGEDTNLTWTLQKHGYRLGYSPKALAYTTEPERWSDYIKQVRRWASSSAQVISRNRSQLSHPGRFLIIGTWLWDLIGVSLLFWAAVILRAHAGHRSTTRAKRHTHHYVYRVLSDCCSRTRDTRSTQVIPMCHDGELCKQMDLRLVSVPRVGTWKALRVLDR